MGGFHGSIPHFLSSEYPIDVKRRVLIDICIGKIPFCIKQDGVNMYVTYDVRHNQLMLARNKQQIQQNEFSPLETRDELIKKGLFPHKIVEFLEKKLKVLPNFVLKQIFESNKAKIYYNCELIGPRYENIIPYSINTLLFLPDGHRTFDKTSILPLIDAKPVFLLGQALEFDSESQVQLEKYQNFNDLSEKNGFYDVLSKSIEELESFLLQNVPISSKDYEIDHKLEVITSKSPIDCRKFAVEGIIFGFEHAKYKLTGDFSLINGSFHANLKTKSHSVALFPGGFRPPHRGHLSIVDRVLQDCDKLLVLISPKDRGNMTSVMSKRIWEIFLEGYNNVQVAVTPVSPIKYIIDNLDDLCAYRGGLKIIQSQKDAGRFEHLEQYFVNDNISIKEYSVEENISSTQMRTELNNDNREIFFGGLPRHLSLVNKEKIWNLLKQKETDYMPFYMG